MFSWFPRAFFFPSQVLLVSLGGNLSGRANCEKKTPVFSVKSIWCKFQMPLFLNSWTSWSQERDFAAFQYAKLIKDVHIFSIKTISVTPIATDLWLEDNWKIHHQVINEWLYLTCSQQRLFNPGIYFTHVPYTVTDFSHPCDFSPSAQSTSVHRNLSIWPISRALDSNQDCGMISNFKNGMIVHIVPTR